MKKLITVSLLSGLLSLPTVVFAEASWYGSVRAGVSSGPTEDSRTTSQSGVTDFDSRWGIKGSSEVSEGLTAVYRYERKIESTDASDSGGRLSYVGLSGRFGTITVGQVWSASYNSFGAIVDKSGAYGMSDTTTRVGNAVSYAVTVGNLSLQADAIMDSSTKKSVDAFQVGATLGGLMETGSIAAAHIQHADVKGDGDKITFDGAIAPDYVVKNSFIVPKGTTAKSSSSYIVGQYEVGGMAIHLGASRYRSTNTCSGGLDENNQPIDLTGPFQCMKKVEHSATYAGIQGDVGDTGVSYFIQMRDLDSKRTDNLAPNAQTLTFSSTPWVLGLSRKLGGGASVHFEHGDIDIEDNITGVYADSTGIWLQVDF